jgi:hypothetical protein
LVFTGYIDAIRHDDVDLGTAEDRRPLRSEYHVNYRQKSGKRYGLPPLLLEGVDSPPGPTVNVNVTNTVWGADLDHLTIDHNGTTIDRFIDGFEGPASEVEPVHYGLIDTTTP